jgi:hypothetical protein
MTTKHKVGSKKRFRIPYARLLRGTKRYEITAADGSKHLVFDRDADRALGAFMMEGLMGIGEGHLFPPPYQGTQERAAKDAEWLRAAGVSVREVGPRKTRRK